MDSEILERVEKIVQSGDDLKIWQDLGAPDSELKKRKLALEKFLEKIKSERPKAKPRKRPKQKTPIFSTGDCLIFKLENGNYGGAVVIGTDTNPETAYNLVATTRINQPEKPTIDQFLDSEVLIKNFGEWKDKPDVAWYMPDLYHKDFADIYEHVGTIEITRTYLVNNYSGEGYLFEPTWTAGWSMNTNFQMQLASEETKPKPERILTVQQLTKDNSKIKSSSKPKNWWNFFKRGS